MTASAPTRPIVAVVDVGDGRLKVEIVGDATGPDSIRAYRERGGRWVQVDPSRMEPGELRAFAAAVRGARPRRFHPRAGAAG